MLVKPSQKLRLRLAIRRSLTKVTLLTWIIWAALISDLAAPGYLKFNLIVTNFDAATFITDALEQQ